MVSSKETVLRNPSDMVGMNVVSSKETVLRNLSDMIVNEVSDGKCASESL